MAGPFCSISPRNHRKRHKIEIEIRLNRLMSVFFIFGLGIENFDRNDGFDDDLYNEIGML